MMMESLPCFITTGILLLMDFFLLLLYKQTDALHSPRALLWFIILSEFIPERLKLMYDYQLLCLCIYKKKILDSFMVRG